MQTNPIMRNVLAVGVILLFIGVAVAPSINATVTQKTNINRTIEIKTTSQSVSDFFKKSHDLFKVGDSIKHPLLFIIVLTLPMFRWIRAYILFLISSGYGWKNPDWGIRPLMNLRAFWLALTIEYWYTYWDNVSDSQGWNWPPLLKE